MQQPVLVVLGKWEEYSLVALVWQGMLRGLLWVGLEREQELARWMYLQKDSQVVWTLLPEHPWMLQALLLAQEVVL